MPDRSGLRPGSPGAAPAQGHHTREIFAEVLGATEAEELIERGILVAAESPAKSA